MRAIVVVNPRARLVTGVDVGDAISRALRDAGVEVEVHTSRSEEDARDAAREAVRNGCDAVVAAGGDGTVNSVIGAVAGTDVALGVVPLGTANVVAEWAGIATGDVRGACEAVAAGKARRVDLGCLNGRHFVAMAGIGLDAQVAGTVDGRWKRRTGRYAFVGRFLWTVLRGGPRRCRVSIGGKAEEELGLWGIILCNGPNYTWRMTLVPDALSDDGELEIVLLHECSRLALLRLAYLLFVAGRPAYGQRHVTVHRAAELTAECDEPAPWQTDGDVGGETPVRVSVLQGGLRLITR
jgi:diacylglycerol kinase (ATP)